MINGTEIVKIRKTGEFDESESRDHGTIEGLIIIDNRPAKKCAKCGAPFDLTKYKGKYYCKGCLDKILRW